MSTPNQPPVKTTGAADQFVVELLNVGWILILAIGGLLFAGIYRDRAAVVQGEEESRLPSFTAWTSAITWALLPAATLLPLLTINSHPIPFPFAVIVASIGAIAALVGPYFLARRLSAKHSIVLSWKVFHGETGQSINVAPLGLKIALIGGEVLTYALPLVTLLTGWSWLSVPLLAAVLLRAGLAWKTGDKIGAYNDYALKEQAATEATWGPRITQMLKLRPADFVEAGTKMEWMDGDRLVVSPLPHYPLDVNLETANHALDVLAQRSNQEAELEVYELTAERLVLGPVTEITQRKRQTAKLSGGVAAFLDTAVPVQETHDPFGGGTQADPFAHVYSNTPVSATAGPFASMPQPQADPFAGMQQPNQQPQADPFAGLHVTPPTPQPTPPAAAPFTLFED